MRIAIFLLSFVVALGIFVNYSGPDISERVEEQKVTPEDPEEDIKIEKSEEEDVPTQTPATDPSPTVVLGESDRSERDNVSNFIYHGAVVVDRRDGVLELTSTDDPEIITEWYKDKISSMNVKSFVTTSTNGNVENKLSGAGSGTQINVEIKKLNTESTTSIIITR